jgi:hypothetical protein
MTSQKTVIVIGYYFGIFTGNIIKLKVTGMKLLKCTTEFTSLDHKHEDYV